jgi:hypothetical protein
MSAMTAMNDTAAVPVYSSRQKAGFVLGVIVALSNIPLAFIPTNGTDVGDQPGPPVSVLVVTLVLGLAICGLLLWSYRTGRKGPIRAAAVLLVVTALLAMPAFFVDGIAAWIRLLAGIYVLATIASMVLLFSPAPRPAVLAPSR